MRLDDLARERPPRSWPAPPLTPPRAWPTSSGRTADWHTARAVGAGVAVVALIGGWFAITANGSGEPEPAEPVVRNGVLLMGVDRGFHKVDGVGGEPLDRPDDPARYRRVLLHR